MSALRIALSLRVLAAPAVARFVAPQCRENLHRIIWSRRCGTSMPDQWPNHPPNTSTRSSSDPANTLRRRHGASSIPQEQHGSSGFQSCGASSCPSTPPDLNATEMLFAELKTPSTPPNLPEQAIDDRPRASPCFHHRMRQLLRTRWICSKLGSLAVRAPPLREDLA